MAYIHSNFNQGIPDRKPGYRLAFPVCWDDITILIRTIGLLVLKNLAFAQNQLLSVDVQELARLFSDAL